jgi:hypothetical protein
MPVAVHQPQVFGENLIGEFLMKALGKMGK